MSLCQKVSNISDNDSMKTKKGGKKYYLGTEVEGF
jgi:hypothetical protein